MADEAQCTCHHGPGCSICAKRDPSDHRRWCPARPAVVQPAQPDDDGLRQRVEALAEEWRDQAENLKAESVRAQGGGERTYVTFWLGKADAYSGAFAQIRRALDGSSGDQQDGAR